MASSDNERSRKRKDRGLDVPSGAINENSAGIESCSTGSDLPLCTVEKLLHCPICLDLIEDPYVTKCGHTFCLSCITNSLKVQRKCPTCLCVVESADQLTPNEAVWKVAKQLRESRCERKRLKLSSQTCFTSRTEAGSSTESDATHLADVLLNADLNLSTVSSCIELLQRRKAELQMSDRVFQDQVVLKFLTRMIKNREQQITRIKEELQFLLHDQQTIQDRLGNSGALHAVPDSNVVVLSEENNSPIRELRLSDSEPLHTSPGSTNQGREVEVSEAKARRNSLTCRERLMNKHFDDLEQCYLGSRVKPTFGAVNNDGLGEFVESMARFTQFNEFNVLATLNYNADPYNALSIVSSIEFDNACEHFAVAGVTRKIKIYDYASVVHDHADVLHYPMGEMHCSSKISCISWNQYLKNVVASSDYEGTVQIWDANTLQCTSQFQEHERRCWSVNFNLIDPRLLASGSDDAKVKLWRTDQKNSICTIETKVNVCCVYFNPHSSHHLAFGSADHRVHYYDLRQAKQPLKTLVGHKKAVSYVKFCSKDELASASTDSHLRLWSVESGQCLRTFSGHSNEKNFVGLATDGRYIVCGSENNSLYVYYKDLSKPLLQYKFGAEAGLLGGTKSGDDNGDFVSAVCWKRDSNVVLAANSSGTIKLLELTS